MKAKFIAYLVLIIAVIVYAIVEIITFVPEPEPWETYEPMTDEQFNDLYSYNEYDYEAMDGPPVEASYDDESTLDYAEVEPEFPGGEEEMRLYIEEHVRYPELSRELGEQGTVYVQFVVHTNGSIQQVEVLKGVSELLDEEAIRVVKNMPAWEPGKQNGETVRVRFTLPIRFSLEY